MKLKLVKVLLIVLLFLLLIYFLVLTIIKNSFNINSFKNNINSEIATKILEYNKHYLFQKKNIKFLIRGGVSFSIFPNIKLIINDINIENVQYKDILLTANIKKVEINLDFLNFLKKQLKFEGVVLSGINLIIRNNKLPDFYMKKQIVKKIVKLDDNEVFGVKDKLKSFLLGDSEKSVVEEGYKEIELEEETRFDLDNEKVKMMLIDLFKIANMKNFKVSDNLNINFSNMIMSFAKNNNIQKEFRNMSGNINIFSVSKELKLKFNFVLNNVSGVFDVKTKEIKDKFELNFKLFNNQNDKININYIGDNLLTSNFCDAIGDFDLTIDSVNFNNFVQWILPVDSPLYYRFDYKKDFKFSTLIKKNKDIVNIKDLKIKSDNIDIDGNVDFDNNENKIDLTINNLNLDEFIISVSKSKYNTNVDNILIFKYDTLADLISNISVVKKNKSLKNTNIIINVKNIVKNKKVLKDSVLNFGIYNNNYKINNIKMNFGDFNIDINNQQELNGYYYNTINIKGNDFKNIADIFNFKDIINVKNFELSSKIFIYNDTVYLYDYKIDNEKGIIEGSLEYSFNEKNVYLASKINLKNLEIKKDKKKYKTLKENLLWLNNFKNNIFLNLTIENLKYNNISNIYLDLKVNYFSGYINFYDIKKIEFEKYKNIKGNFFMDIREKLPKINLNLSIEKIDLDLDLINLVFDIERYKKILLNTEINVGNQKKYWINRLFLIPAWNEIDGNINLEIQDLNLNNVPFNNINFNSKIENGLVNIENMNFVGLGGSTELRGKVDLKTTKNIHLILTDTIYNIKDIFKLFSKKENEHDILINGTIGVGGIFKASGFNSSIFASSINTQIKFIGQNLYIKKLGLTDLKNKLIKIYQDPDLLNTLKADDVILNNSGTTFSEFNGVLTISNGINNLTVDAKADNISNKLISKIDNSSENTMINIVNTSVIMNKVGDSIVPLYTVISFKEDFANKANLIINTSQIDDYIEKIREKH